MKLGIPPVDIHEPIQINAKAGDMVLAHDQLVHAAVGNLSPDIRYAVYIRMHHADRPRDSPDVLTDIRKYWCGMSDVVGRLTSHSKSIVLTEVSKKRSFVFVYLGIPLVAFALSSFAADRPKPMRTLVFGTEILGKSSDDRVAARTSPPLRHLQFVVSKDLKIEGSYIRIFGWLINETNQPIQVTAFPVSGFYPFAGEIVFNKKITLKPHEGPPLPQQAPPPPMTFAIPGRSRVRFDHGVDLSEVLYKGSPVADLKWTFHFWNEPRPSGMLSIQLPAR